MSNFTIAVCTFGDQSWSDLAHERALPSAASQAAVVHVHGETLHGARNAALDLIETQMVIHLDADDELEPGYVEAMAAASGDLRVPRVRYVENGIEREPIFPRVVGHRHDCSAACFPEGNWCVVGTAVRTDLVREVGGWKPWPIYEDWDLFTRCWLAGGTVERVPDAVYRAHVSPDGRNHGEGRAFRLAEFERIQRANFPHLYEEAA